MAKKAFVYDGSQWVDIAQSTADLSPYQRINRTGLNVVVPTSATNGTVGTNGAVTIGTAVSSVTVQGAFSATYDNYKISVSGGAGSTSSYVTTTLGATTSGYYGGWTGFTYTSSSSSAGINKGSSWIYSFYVDGANGLNGSMELLQPFATRATYMNSTNATNQQQLAGAGLLTGSTSYTAFTLTPSSGTLTGGTIRIYGYNNN